MKKIILILPYFGKLPEFFDVWLQSAMNNRTIDFLILTDCNIAYKVSPNIKIVHKTFAEFREMCQAAVDYPIALEKPYKLCDWRPLYQVVLKEYLKEYDFAGFVDCDTVLGDIRGMLTEKALEKYSHFLCLGHLQLQKINDPNFEDVLEHVKAQGKYTLQYVLQHSQNFCVDELPYGIPLTYWQRHPKDFFCEYHPDGRPLYDELTPNYNQFVDLYNDKDYLGRFYQLYHFYGRHENVVPFWKRVEHAKRKIRKKLHYRYDEGKLYRCYWIDGVYREEEIIYVHLYKRKMEVCITDFNHYYILPHKFLPSVNKWVVWKETRPRFMHKFRIYWRRELKRIFQML